MDNWKLVLVVKGEPIAIGSLSALESMLVQALQHQVSSIQCIAPSGREMGVMSVWSADEWTVQDVAEGFRQFLTSFS